MKKFGLALSLVLLLFSAHAKAAVILLEPFATTVEVGDTFSLNAMFDREGDEPLALYDLLVDFNPLELELLGISYGTELGDSLVGDSIVGTLDPLNAFQLSLLFDLSGQSVLPFRLFTLEFRALSEAMDSLVQLTDNTAPGAFPSFIGESGFEMNVRNEAQTLVNIIAPPVTVPEPASLLLFGSALIFGFRKKT